MAANHARRTVPTVSLLLLLALAALPAAANDQHPRGRAQCVPAAPGSLPDQVAKLAARVAKLEGKIKPADLVGRYAVTSVSLSLTGSTDQRPRPAAISHSAGRAFLTLNADGTTRFEPNNSPVPCGASALTQGAPWTLAPTPCGDDGEETGRWSYADGILQLSSEDGSEMLPLDVGMGGRLLTIAWSGLFAEDQQSETTLIIASRLK